MGVSLSDHLAGTFAAYGVLAALMARTTSGRGQKVETSLLQATLAFLGENAATFFEDGRILGGRQRGQRQSCQHDPDQFFHRWTPWPEMYPAPKRESSPPHPRPPLTDDSHR